MSDYEGHDAGVRPWRAYVDGFVACLAAGRAMPLSAGFVTTPAREPLAAAEVLLCSPHPDDEALTGALALRLRLEGQTSVLNLAMTLGSDPRRQAARRAELAAACRLLGFQMCLPRESSGFVLGGPAAPVPGSIAWQAMEDELVALLAVIRPRLICLPHDDDGHATHVAVHHLVRQAVLCHVRQEGRELLLAQTEFWRPMRSPNLLVGVAPAEVAILVNALSHHVGEMVRHPLHLLLPPRLMDNVRRGTALLAGHGGSAVTFPFGELYRISLVRPDGIRQPVDQIILPPSIPLRLNGLFDLLAPA